MPPEDSALLGPRCGAQGCPIEPDRTSATVRGRNRTILSTRPAPNFREEKKKVLPAYQLGTLGHASDEERCTRLVFLFFWWGRGGEGGWVDGSFDFFSCFFWLFFFSHFYENFVTWSQSSVRKLTMLKTTMLEKQLFFYFLLFISQFNRCCLPFRNLGLGTRDGCLN